MTDTQGISAISHRRFHQAPVRNVTEMCQQNERYKCDSANSLQVLNTRSNSGSHMDIIDASGDAQKCMDLLRVGSFHLDLVCF